MSDDVKENEVKLGRPARQVSITDICSLVRHYKGKSYETDRPLNHAETPLFDYIKESKICSLLSRSQEEAEIDVKIYDNPAIYGDKDTTELKERALNRVLSDEKTINDIRIIISELDDKTWSRILSRKRQKEHRKKTAKKKIAVSDEVFYRLSNIKTNLLNDQPWDVVLAKLADVFNTISDMKSDNTSLYEPSKQKRDELDKLLDSLLN
jgi:hypothetical protein